MTLDVSFNFYLQLYYKFLCNHNHLEDGCHVDDVIVRGRPFGDISSFILPSNSNHTSGVWDCMANFFYYYRLYLLDRTDGLKQSFLGSCCANLRYNSQIVRSRSHKIQLAVSHVETCAASVALVLYHVSLI